MMAAVQLNWSGPHPVGMVSKWTRGRAHRSTWFMHNCTQYSVDVEPLRSQREVKDLWEMRCSIAEEAEVPVRLQKNECLMSDNMIVWVHDRD